MRAIDYFDKAAEAYGERTAIVDGAQEYSFRETREISYRLARAMWSKGMRGDERAAIYSPNVAGVLFALLGIMRSGAVWVPINYRNALEANVEYMNYVEVSWLFYHSTFRDSVNRLVSLVPSLRRLVCLDSDREDHPFLKDFLDEGDGSTDLDWADPYGNPERLVGLVPTGGTTGPARGVRVTNLAWGTMTEMGSHYWRCDDIEPVCLTTAPLSHAAGPVAFIMFALGARNVLLPRFDPLEVLRSIERFRVTHIFLPPTAFYSLLSHSNVRSFDYSSLRLFLLAGSPVSPDKLRQGVQVFGPCICQCYGQTESPMLLTWLSSTTIAAAASGDHSERLRSCGKATSAVRLAAMDDEGRILSPNQVGEIVARGSLVTPGYYKMPEATAEIRTHGWHHTGDVGFVDDDGFFYIVDRKKDMIVTGGFNVYCAEVEAGIMALPQILECAVFGVPDDKWGEAVRAVLVLREGEALTELQVINHCKQSLGGVKTPKSVEFRNEIPKTPAGKIDRKALRKPFWAGCDRQVH
jgi:fatty-acyl-CoA synthase